MIVVADNEEIAEPVVSWTPAPVAPARASQRSSLRVADTAGTRCLYDILLFLRGLLLICVIVYIPDEVRDEEAPPVADAASRFTLRSSVSPVSVSSPVNLAPSVPFQEQAIAAEHAQRVSALATQVCDCVD
jgi:hypothetical protein